MRASGWRKSVARKSTRGGIWKQEREEREGERKNARILVENYIIRQHFFSTRTRMELGFESSNPSPLYFSSSVGFDLSAGVILITDGFSDNRKWLRELVSAYRANDSAPNKFPPRPPFIPLPPSVKNRSLREFSRREWKRIRVLLPASR